MLKHPKDQLLRLGLPHHSHDLDEQGKAAGKVRGQTPVDTASMVAAGVGPSDCGEVGTGTEHLWECNPARKQAAGRDLVVDILRTWGEEEAHNIP
jgi:hypothetical protein